MHRTPFSRFVALISQPKIALSAAAIVGVLGVGATIYIAAQKPSAAYATAVEKSITEEVDTTGTVTSVDSADLSFERSGQISQVNTDVGKTVAPGDVLLAINSADLAASLAGAQAALETQEANLANLQAGTRPEQLAIDQSTAQNATTALMNAVQNAYVVAEDGVQNKLDPFFDSSSALKEPLVLTNQYTYLRLSLDGIVSQWGTEVNAATPADPVTLSSEADAHLTALISLTDQVSQALNQAANGSSVTPATLQALEAQVTGVRLSLTGGKAALDGAETALTSASGALTLAQAGATANALAAQQAQVDAASAAVQSAQAQLAETVLRAPIAGVVTRQDAHLGETVSPGTVLVSVISSGTFEAEAEVSQADIAKIAVGNTVAATFGAYPGASFPATVVTVDPAATIAENGTPSYKVTVAFTTPDPRIKAGLSAALHISTAQATDALTVPRSAVITDGVQQFVFVHGANGASVKTPVTTGIIGSDGSIQILSGLEAGEQVVTYGSSTNS